MSDSSSSLGFSLLEWLIALFILMIFSSLALPSFSQLLARLHTDSYIYSLSNSLSFARNQAVTTGSVVTLCPLKNERCTKDWQQPISIFRDQNYQLQLDNPSQLLRELRAVRSIDSLTYPRNGISFRPDGTIMALQNGTFRYCPLKKLTPNATGITLNQTGRAKITHSLTQC